MGKPFGNIFGEEIIVSQSVIKHPLHEHDTAVGVRSPWIFICILLLGIGLLFVRLFYVTVYQGERYQKLAAENRIAEKRIVAPRGIVYDRSGSRLIRNIPVFKGNDGISYFEEAPASSTAHLSESITRQYIYTDLFAHIIGFIGEASKDEIGENSAMIKAGDIVGKMGVEKIYDVLLRGKDGKELTEVDATGQKVRVLGRIEPAAGKPLTLTLDSTIQKTAQDALSGKTGAIIASVPQNGEILALYSSPSFDPNRFIQEKELEDILKDKNQPLFNRAIAGRYPPGSTFKIVTALAALENGTVGKDTKVEDAGTIHVGEFSYGNWYFLQYGKIEGFLNIVEALKRSNDIFFYKTGETLGIEKLAAMAKKVGIGTSLNIDLDTEGVGVMPDPVWKKEVKGENWYLGDTYHVAIGQGDLLTTPLEVNTWTNVIANGGKLCAPHVVQVQSSIFKVQSECKDLGFRKETIELIREGMKQACEVGGTGWPLFKFKVQSSKIRADGIDFFQVPESTSSGKPWVSIPVACKTGTAEFGDKLDRTHAWFTMFAPVYNPQISITVLVEGGGEGSSVAAPIAKKMLEEWFGR